MTDDRPVLVGMNNPYGGDPAYALYPLPERATGWRLWQMLESEVPGAGMTEYRDAFDRRNLLVGPWRNRDALPAADAMRGDLCGRTVVLLGAKVRAAFRLPATACGSESREHVEAPPELRFTHLHWVPHPSGLCHWYNDPANRRRVAVLLSRLYRGARGRLTV